MTEQVQDHLIVLAGGVVSAYVANNQVPLAEVTNLLGAVYGALAGLHKGEGPEPVPAVSVKKSITDEYLICLEDGKKLKTMKRYLRTHHKMSPDQYRTKWHLPSDYPMVSPAYRVLRSKFAKQIGLGRGHSARKYVRGGAKK